MSEKDRNNCSNDAVEKIIGNMTAEMQNVDGQYVPLTFTTSTQNNDPTLNWTQQPTTNPYISSFNPYNPNTTDLGYVHLDHYNQLNQQQQQQQQQQQAPPGGGYNFIQPPSQPQQQIYDLNDYKNYIYDGRINSQPMYGTNPLIINQTTPTHGLSHDERGNLMGLGQQSTQPAQLNSHLIENLVGNWVPNTSGTYSPFGNVDPFQTTKVGLFEKIQDKDGNGVIGRQILDDSKLIMDQPLLDETKQFHQFTSRNNTGARRPRMVAEVKPMRPSYSDVLTKSAPQQIIVNPTQNNKVLKETKQKKEGGKKNNKTDKFKQTTQSVNRINSTNDLKDTPADKTNQFVKITSTDQGMKTNKPDTTTTKGIQLNRKWASLDNISEPLTVNKIVDESKKKLKEDVVSNHNKTFPKANPVRKVTNRVVEMVDVSETSLGSKTERTEMTKNGLKKVQKFTNKARNSEQNERPPGKRNQRIRKRENHVPFGVIGQKLNQYLKSWWKLLTAGLLWLLHLISDICSLSIHISRDMAQNFWLWLRVHWALFIDSICDILQRIRLFTWIYEKFKKQEPAKDSNRTFIHSGLQNNINMPTTGEEAMKRLLACKGKDPYSILGVTPTCTDDDIKRYYKRQAFLVHPDKNQQPGAEEAFKILVHAFDMIGEPERRAAYDKGVIESVQVEQAWSEFTELLAQLQQKVEAAANTIRCSACGLRHKRIKVDRPSYAARNCATCKIHHAAREGDIWAEAKVFGFLWHYYACMEGGVYDITEWAGCQKDSLKHLRPDTHQVQYRIALGKQNGQPRRHSGSPRSEKPPDLENLLNSLYGQAEGMQGTRRKSKKGNK